MTQQEAIARELARHTEGFLWAEGAYTGGRADTGGLKCSCGEWEQLPEEGTFYRPYAAFRQHVAAEVYKALQAQLVPELREKIPQVTPNPVAPPFRSVRVSCTPSQSTPTSEVEQEAKRVWDKAVSTYLHDNPGDGSFEDLTLTAASAVYSAGMDKGWTDAWDEAR
jgi:hypothetical protein